MAKTLLTISVLLILAFIIIAIYCALIIAGRSDKDNSSIDSNEENNNRFCKRQICPKCKTGKESYNLDIHSDACPYIGCYKNGKCRFYVPLEEPSKQGELNFSKKNIRSCAVKRK